MKHLFFTLLLALSCAQVAAQPLHAHTDSIPVLPDPDRYTTSIYAMTTLGPSAFAVHTGYNNMYRLLQAQEVQLLWRDRTLYSIGFGARLRRWHLEFLLANSFGLTIGEYPSFATTYLEAKTDFFTTHLSMGYALIQGRNDVWVIRGGAGMTEYYLSILEVAPGRSLDMANIRSSSSLRLWRAFSHTSGIGDVSIDWRRGGRPKRGVSVATNVSLGYQFGLGRPQWKSTDVQVLNAPTDRAGTIYLRLEMRIAHILNASKSAEPCAGLFLRTGPKGRSLHC